MVGGDGEVEWSEVLCSGGVEVEGREMELSCGPILVVHGWACPLGLHTIQRLSVN